MLRILLSSSVAAIALMTNAWAADLPSRATPAPYIAPVPVFTWAGLYVGLNAGVGFNGRNNNNAATPTGFGGTAALDPTGYTYGGTFGSHSSGFTGGATVGYNWQTGALVYGLEADLNYIDRGRGSGTYTTYPATVAATQAFALVNSGSTNSKFVGTARARLGYAVDRALFFVTGGLAYSGGSNSGGSIYYYNTTAATANAAIGTPTAIYTSSGGRNNFGYTLGAGVEYAFTNNWSAKLEYDYISLGRRNTTYTYSSGTNPVTGASFTSNRNTGDLNRVIAGINYKF